MYPAIPNFELFFEHAADLLFIATSDGRMKAANECFRKVTGYADESNPLEQLFVAPTWSSIMQSATSGPTAETPFQIRTAADVLIGVKGKVFVEEESGDLCGLFRSNSLVTVPDPLQNSEPVPARLRWPRRSVGGRSSGRSATGRCYVGAGSTVRFGHHCSGPKKQAVGNRRIYAQGSGRRTLVFWPRRTLWRRFRPMCPLGGDRYLRTDGRADALAKRTRIVATVVRAG